MLPADLPGQTAPILGVDFDPELEFSQVLRATVAAVGAQARATFAHMSTSGFAGFPLQAIAPCCEVSQPLIGGRLHVKCASMCVANLYAY